ncbi:hypothetical protein CJF30_00005236 [Rutstroemia sp. NJR-2017a BBW]|nr:hypothetical protein CJF30_00005236 [Rutstroemia sp. NJR-2017a BBW]
MFLSQQDHHRLLAAASEYCQHKHNYAFAVVQGSDCWCSNYVPGSTTSTDDCANPCPGYPTDTCGGDNTYGYIQLILSPSGTKGAATTAASSTTLQVTTSSASPDAVTIYSTVTESPATTSLSSSSTPPSTSIKSTSQNPATTSDTVLSTTAAPLKATSASSDTSSTWTPTPIISLETITGQVRTVTVTPTAPPNSQSNSTVSKSKSGGLSTGGAVGLTVGLVALVAIIAGIAFFCIRKRRQEKAEAYNAVNSRRESMAGLGGPIPSRTMSENSRYVLGTDGRRVVETWEPEILRWYLWIPDWTRSPRFINVEKIRVERASTLYETITIIRDVSISKDQYFEL